jgi:putative tryptophan/tyrosine transport system substrate-binding protein
MSSPKPGADMKRREFLGALGGTVVRRSFITILGGAAVAWPLAARAQQPERIRRIGVLMNPAIDPESQADLAVFVQGLQRLGWVDGGNVRIDVRWGDGNPAIIGKHAAELVALAPDIIFTTGGAPVASLIQASRTVPVVFALTPDPVGSGYVTALSRPGGNATGFMQFEYTLSAKWPELLKEIAPGVTRAAVLRDPANAPGIGQFAVIQSAAPLLGMEVSPVSLQDVSEMERSVAAFAHAGNGALIVTASALAGVHRHLIVTVAARHKLPAVYYRKGFVTAGGLISYGPDFTDQYRRAAVYVDRILKGEKPADLPVQAPTNYELAINLKTAKAHGIIVPPTLLTRADEVVE